MINYMRSNGPSFARVVRDEPTGSFIAIDMDDHTSHAEIMMTVTGETGKISHRACNGANLLAWGPPPIFFRTYSPACHLECVVVIFPTNCSFSSS